MTERLNVNACKDMLQAPHVAQTCSVGHVSGLTRRDILKLGAAGTGVAAVTAVLACSESRMAELGDQNVLFNMGLKYYKGEEVPQDYAKARELWTKASERGMPEAQYNLGVMYCRGEGVARDYNQALKLFRTAAFKGKMGDAMYNVYLMYENGYGVKKDIQVANKW